MKLIEYLTIIVREKREVTFNAVVTDMRRMGLFVELVDLQMRGLVKVEDLPRGNWRFDAGAMRYAAGKREINLGQQIEVQVIWVDTEQRQVDVKVVGGV